MTDITWCISSDCACKCERHISKCQARPGELVSVSDFSKICRKYIHQVLEGVMPNENNRQR